MAFLRARELTLAVLLAGAAGTLAQAADPYDVHVILEQTGAFAFFGAKQTEALHAIESSVNAQGGIKGRPLRFIIHDDQTNPQVAVQLLNQLRAQNVPVILGPSLSATCSAVYPLIQHDGPVVFCYTPVVAPPPKSFAFRASPAVEDFQPVVVRYFLKRGLKNLALITTSDATGQSFDSRIDATLSRPEFRDVKLVARERFNPSDISAAAQVARIKAAKPDAILTYAAGPAFGTILHGIGDSGLDVPVYGSGANMNVSQLQQYAGFLPKELFFNGAAGLVEDPAAPAAVRRQQVAVSNSMREAGLHMEIGHQLTWDPTMVVISALQSIGPNATADGIHDYLEHLKNWPGSEGVYNFTTGDQAGLGESGAALFRYVPAKATWELLSSNGDRSAR
jgi:branched-chain amino acid transport system substrate-binding protein